MTKKPQRQTLKEMLAEDSSVIQYRRIVNTLFKNIDLVKLRGEALGLHSGRPSRSLAGTSPGPGAIQKAVLQDNSNRSRLVEIRVELTELSGILEEAVKNIRSYITTEYQEEMPDGLRTKEDRSSFVGRFIPRGIEFKSKVDNLIKQLDLLINDIDQGHWNVSIAYKVLELQYGKNSKEKNL